MNAELKKQKRSIRREAIILMNAGKFREAGIILDGGEEEATVSERKLNRKFSHDVIYFGGVPEYSKNDFKFPKKMYIRDIQRDVYYSTFAEASKAYGRSTSFSQKRIDLFEKVKLNWIVRYKGMTGSVEDISYNMKIEKRTLMRYARTGDVEVIRCEVMEDGLR